MSLSSPHLSEEALDDLLIEAGSAADAAHLASCPECSARLEEFRSSDWAQARSNSISRELTPRSSRFAILPAWAVAAAFFFAVALSFLVGIHRGLAPGGTASDQAQVAADAISDGQEDLAGDNAMLHAIDTAISQPVPSPVEVYRIDNTRSTTTRGTVHEVRD